MSKKLELLLQIDVERQRFDDRLADAIADTKVNAFGPSKKFAALKRAAMDLKELLNKLNKTTELY